MSISYTPDPEKAGWTKAKNVHIGGLEFNTRNQADAKAIAEVANAYSGGGNSPICSYVGGTVVLMTDDSKELDLSRSDCVRHFVARYNKAINS
jgi:hypothetical protein